MNKTKIYFKLITLLLFFTELLALKIGEIAPDFSLLNQNNKIEKLSNYKGSFIVLYFYPKDDTLICTKQACLFKDNFRIFKENNIIILGINYDSPKSHKSFINKYNLPFDLLSDSNKQVTKLYGASSWLLFWPQRKTFIIDPSGKIYKILSDIDLPTHTKTILNLVKDFKK